MLQVIEKKDNYMEWLKARRDKILNDVHDPFFRKILLEIHEDYATTYIVANT
jgi:hypothetical protein